MKRICVLLILIVSTIWAQPRQMTVAQLSGFIKSSVEAHPRLDDKVIAEFLKNVKLTEKLEPKVVNELMELGAGSRTSAALRDLANASASLAPPPKAEAVAVAPVPKPQAPTLTEPAPEKQHEILEAIREYALNYTQGLPNFICMQVTRREEDRTGTGDHYQSVDKLQEQLTYNDHQEKYIVQAVNGQMVEHRDHMKMGGAMSSGEFGSMMYEIFEPTTAAEFHWDRLRKLDGVIMNSYTYRVTQERSHYSIYHSGVNRTIIAGYHGAIYARQSDNVIIKITLECEDIPHDFPIKEVKSDLRYDVRKLSGHEFILPVSWQNVSRDGNALSRNTAEFSLYKKYEADTNITFATDDDDKDKDKKNPPPVKKP